MNPQTPNSRALALVPALMLSVVLTPAWGKDATNATGRDPLVPSLEGTWESEVSIRECSSGAVLRTFKGLTAIHRGGTASATNNMPPVSGSPAYGTWTRDGSRGPYTINLRFFRFAADGSWIGAQDLTRIVDVIDRDHFSGTLSAQVRDTAENILQTICGSEFATRVNGS